MKYYLLKIHRKDMLIKYEQWSTRKQVKAQIKFVKTWYKGTLEKYSVDYITEKNLDKEFKHV